MKIKHLLVAAFFGLGLTPLAQAEGGGLTIHAVEIGVGKFHRLDNKNHPYDASNSWLPYVISDSATTQTPLVVQNSDKSVSIFFSNLEELMNQAVLVAQAQKQSIAVLNIHAHGLPGGTWFPANQSTQDSFECQSWKDSANGDDKGNYDQYYSAIPKEEIMQMRSISHSPGASFGCTTGLTEWQQESAKVPAFKAALASDVQIHFLSCVVGLGEAGDALLQGIAKALFTSSTAKVLASTNFGLGDWSMSPGMGFWDFQSDEQLDHDNQIYPVNRKDSELMQKGTVRSTQLDAQNNPVSQLIANVSYLKTDASAIGGTVVAETFVQSSEPVPYRVKIPGTNAYVYAR